MRILAGIALILSGSAAIAATPTDFGMRIVGQPITAAPLPSGSATAPSAGLGWTPLARTIDLTAISAIGRRWGTVTSTLRSPAHNRRVGGVANSYHLKGRAIDIARRPGVSHGQIAAAYRAAGYHLIESLDAGDHSHFAFGAPASFAGRATKAQERSSEVTAWRMVSAPSAGTLRR